MPAEPSSQQTAIAQAVALLDHYAFDTGRQAGAELALQWLQHYHPTWIRAAAIEALYLGRYKAVSVAQILEIWERRGQPTPHFNGDFERLICRKLPDYAVNAVDAFLLNEYTNAATTVAAPPAESERAARPRVDRLKAPRSQAVAPAAPASEIVPTAERSAIPPAKPVMLVGIAPAAVTQINSSIFYSPIRIYAPPADASEFYTRLRRFVARSFTRVQPQPVVPVPLPTAPHPPTPPAAADDWVLELGTWQLELDEDEEPVSDAAGERLVERALPNAAADAKTAERPISE